MKKKLLLITSLVVAASIVYDSNQNKLHSNSQGAIAGVTGSPGDGGGTCIACHNGTNTVRNGIITSNIPAEGYTPGTTYTITATVGSPNRTVFGFEISPQNPSGTLLGSIVLTNTTETKLIGNGKYITHKLDGTTGNGGTKTWTFNWIAPNAGTGDVTFYGAFNLANGNGSTNGDSILTSSLLISERISSGIFASANSNIHIYPNPLSNTGFLQLKTNDQLENASLKITDAQGRIVKELQNIYGNTISIDKTMFSKGVYIFLLEMGGKYMGSGKVLVE